MQHHNKELRSLQTEWNKKLAESGYEDIEDRKGNLKQPFVRSVSWQNQERIRDFFLDLDSYLTNTPDIPPLTRRVLELWSSGMFQSDICNEVNRTREQVRLIIRNIKKLLLSK